jgi:uncharacterized RDD family membrane protein YckC
MSDYYEIHLEGQLDPRWSDWLEGMTIEPLENGDTLLSGPAADQAALHGLLNRIRDLNLKLVSVEKIEIVTESKIKYAGLWPRFLALLADFAIFCACFFPVTRLVKGVWLMSPKDHLWVNGWFISDPLCLIFLIVMALYMILLEAWLGATLGKWLLGLRVVRVDGGRPGLWKSLVRNALRFIDSLPTLNILGVILILKSRERVRFGDRVAGTRVIDVRSIRSASKLNSTRYGPSGRGTDDHV